MLSTDTPLTINQIETELKEGLDDPIRLASFLTILAGYTAYYTEMLKKVLIPKSGKWLEFKLTSQIDDTPREKPLSDKHTDMLWASSSEGQKEIALTYELRRLDIMYKSISKRLWSMEKDYRMSKSQV